MGHTLSYGKTAALAASRHFWSSHPGAAAWTAQVACYHVQAQQARPRCAHHYEQGPLRALLKMSFARKACLVQVPCMAQIWPVEAALSSGMHRKLENATGLRTLNLGYPSRAQPLASLAKGIAAEILQEVGSQGQVFLVTHSAHHERCLL